MIVIEAKHWPLVAVGALPDSRMSPDLASVLTDEQVWRSGDLRLAVVISGSEEHAWAVQEEVFAWLRSHRSRLWRCVSRAAWIVEDELTRRQVERWLDLAGDRLFRGEVTTFRSVRAAVSWLVTDQASGAS